MHCSNFRRLNQSNENVRFIIQIGNEIEKKAALR